MINYIQNDNALVVYWERSADDCGGIYSVFLNGKEIGSTKNTFYEIAGYNPAQVAEIAVYKADSQRVEKILLGKARICAHTAKRLIDVTQAPYYAVGDGKTLNTTALRQALSDCADDEIVYLPQGIFLSGALEMKSGTELYLEKGAVLQGTCDLNDYLPKHKARFEGIERECYRPLIKIGNMDNGGACATKNVRISGGGTICGGGAEFADKIIRFEMERMSEGEKRKLSLGYECEKTIPGRCRPFLIDVCNSENVQISDLTIKNGPAWNIHIVYSKDVTIYGCDVSSAGIWNGDGIDPDSSENVTIFNCRFSTHDDAIAVKSGKNPQGNIINRPAKNIRIFSCCGKNGIAIGSEMSGGVDGVYVWDCDFSDSYSGFWIKTTEKRGGYVKNIHVSDCSFVNIRYSGAVAFNNDGERAEKLPAVENLSFRRLELSGISTDGFGDTCAVPPIDFVGSETYKPSDCVIEDISLIKTEKTAYVKTYSGLKIDNIENVELNRIDLKK